MTHSENREPGLPAIDVREYGGKKGTERQSMDRRLYMQLLVVDAAAGQSGDDLGKRLGEACAAAGVASVIYADAMSPQGVGLLTWSEDPAYFVRFVRPLFARDGISQAILRPDYAMIGRTYSIGHEPDLEHALLRRSVENVKNDAFRWHVWYPLRRTGAFARLEPHDQGMILREHAQIGMAYGAQDLAHDIRLACYGLDAADNEFVIGLVGRDLHPLSHLVQAMRRTRQTSEFIERMGPFFVGYVAQRVG
jgi:chlorite dismutase